MTLFPSISFKIEADSYTLTDTGATPTNPLEKWDVGLDNKIGLPEAIRALQVVVGMGDKARERMSRQQSRQRPISSFSADNH